MIRLAKCWCWAHQEASIILFVSDQPGYAGERGLWFGYFFEGSVAHVPLMISAPDITPGMRPPLSARLMSVRPYVIWLGISMESVAHHGRKAKALCRWQMASTVKARWRWNMPPTGLCLRALVALRSGPYKYVRRQLDPRSAVSIWMMTRMNCII